MTVRTRFAPSPTGYLHIGGVRTALFCWLFARKYGGQFILRIDDTDQQRNLEATLAPILSGFKWLGIDWDEGPEVGGPCGPYYQSQRLDRYQAAVDKLLASGHAYRDYARPEELAEEREAAEREKRTFVYSRRWMADTPEKQAQFEAEGRLGVVRLKIPRDENAGKIVVDDLIRGRVEFDLAQEQDHVIQRADGTCLYHLASVVDDHEMGITHVIRAEEHLSNTPRQIFIAQSLGYELPRFAHLPVVAEPGSKTKLSKRKIAKYLKNPEFKQLYDHGRAIAARLGLEINDDTFNPVVVDFYEQVGYLPEAIVNYLLLLGWSYDDKTEYFTREEMIEHFSLERVNKSSASFDPAKLRAFQEHYFRALPTEEKVAKVLPFLQRAGLLSEPVQPDTRQYVARVVEAAGDRIKVAGDVLDFDEFFVADDALAYDEKDFAKRVRGDEQAVTLLKQFRDHLAEVEPFEPPALEAALKGFVEQQGIKIGQIIHALRVATTGKGVGLGMFDALALLGRQRCLQRIDRALSLVSS